MNHDDCGRMTKAEQIRMYADKGMKRSLIARRVGCSRPYVTNILGALIKIPRPVVLKISIPRAISKNLSQQGWLRDKSAAELAGEIILAAIAGKMVGAILDDVR